MNEWPYVTIGEVAEVFDGPHATPETVSEGPIFLGISALQNGRIDLRDTRHVAPETFRKWTRRVKPMRDDVVFSYETRLGEAAIIPAGLECCLGRRMGLVRTDRRRLHPGFFLYYYLSPTFQDFLRSRTIHGATVDRIALKEFPSFPIPVPPLEEQVGIAQILGSLDDKIELNRRMNETLEAIAQAIFSEWLRLATPTRVKIADLVADGTLVVGDGYRAKNEELFSPGLPFIRAGELDNGFDVQSAAVLNFSSVEAAGHKRSRSGDVAFTSKGTIGRFARVTNQTPDFVYSPQVCFWRSQDKRKLRPEILYLWMVSDDLRGQIDAVAGQTDMAPYVSLRDQRAMTMPRFGEDQHITADEIAPLLDLQAANAEQNRTLAATRDLLLPKLMSGEIRLQDAGAQLEAAQ